MWVFDRKGFLVAEGRQRHTTDQGQVRHRPEWWVVQCLRGGRGGPPTEPGGLTRLLCWYGGMHRARDRNGTMKAVQHGDDEAQGIAAVVTEVHGEVKEGFMASLTCTVWFVRMVCGGGQRRLQSLF